MNGDYLFQLVGLIAIDASGAKDTIDDIVSSADGLSKNLSGVKASANSASSSMGSTSKFSAAAVWLGNTLSTLSTKAWNLAVKLGQIGFEFNSNMESYQTQFAALLGSEDQAAGLVASLQELAKISPLGMEGLANNAVSLLSTGVELEKIIPTLTMLGNLSLGDSTKMDSVTRAYYQMMGKGKLLAQEINQFTEAGVPIIRLLTEYGGEKYADGSWYQQKMQDPDFVVPFEDINNAFLAATSEDGEWYNYMFKMMDTYAGMMDRLGEEGKETLGALTNPFFGVAEETVLPGLMESLELFNTWIGENEEAITAMAEAIGALVNGGFDMMLTAFQWCVENGEFVATALAGIGTALLIGAIAAHPYAAAISAVVVGLAALTTAYKEQQEAMADAFMSPYANPESQLYGLAGKYAGWSEELKTAADYYIEALSLGYNPDMEEADLWQAAKSSGVDDAEVQAFMQDAANAVGSSDFTIGSQYLWFDENAQETLQEQLGNMELTAEATVEAPNAQADLQVQLDNTNLTATVDVEANYKMLELAASYLGSTGSGNVQPKSSNASGLRYVNEDNHIARLHMGEMVLPRNEAEEYRSGRSGMDTSRLESAINSLSDRVATIMQQVATNTAAGTSVYLDSGALVGQLTPSIDAQLGTLTARKGRRN